GKSDQLQPSRFRGVYRKIAADLNDGIDKVAASSGGQSRKATNLEDVLGDLPAEPQMGAFAVPLGPGPDSAGLAFPSPRPPAARPLPQAPGRAAPPQAARATFPTAEPSSDVRAAGHGAPAPDVEAEWRGVYEQFVATKQQCGEPTDGFTYDKFRKTL